MPHSVPKELSFDQLLQVTVLLDKYDMMNLIRSHQDVWTKSLYVTPLPGSVEQQFFLSWKFKNTKLYIQCLQELTLHTVLIKEADGTTLIYNPEALSRPSQQIKNNLLSPKGFGT